MEERQKGTESDRPKIHSWFPVSISSDGGKEGQYNPETRPSRCIRRAAPLYGLLRRTVLTTTLQRFTTLLSVGVRHAVRSRAGDQKALIPFSLRRSENDVHILGYSNWIICRSFSQIYSNMTDRMSDSIRERQYDQYCHNSSYLSQNIIVTIVQDFQNCHTCQNCHVTIVVNQN